MALHWKTLTLLTLSSALVACGKTTPTYTPSTTVLQSSVQEESSGLTTQQRLDIQKQIASFKAQLNSLKGETKVQAVSKAAVQSQTRLRKTAPKTLSTPSDALYTQKELATLKALSKQMESRIAAEDKAYAAKSDAGFKVKTIEGGKDVDIELFLFHPKYGKRAKFWGIDTAHDFLQAARSPSRRFLLRLKLEGLFAPRGFAQNILFWTEQADLLRVSGISKDQAWLLVANGVTSVPDLARRDNVIELGALRLSLKVQGWQHDIEVPSLDELQEWVEEAKTLDPYIY